MDSKLRQLQHSSAKMTKAFKVLSIVFYLAFVVYALTVATILVAMLFPPEGFTTLGIPEPPIVISVACDTIAGGLTIFVIARIFAVASKGETPFAKSSSYLLTILGALIAISVICKVFITPGLEVGAASGDHKMAFSYDAQNDGSIFIDGRGALEATACFVLAAIFRYGTLLQKETDDLV